MFHTFKSTIKDGIDLCPIELAGKGSRIGEDVNPNFCSLIDDSINCMLSSGELNSFSIFGYSMGGLIAYEVAMKLYWKHNIKPEKIFFAACSPPHISSDENNLNEKEDHELIRRLVEGGGIEQEVFDEPDIVKLFLPIIRADLNLIHSYNYTKPIIPLSIDFVVMYSNDDNKNNNIFEWNRYSSKKCEYYKFIDGHFFIKNHYREIVEIINEKI